MNFIKYLTRKQIIWKKDLQFVATILSSALSPNEISYMMPSTSGALLLIV